jgi:hypothetical protein
MQLILTTIKNNTAATKKISQPESLLSGRQKEGRGDEGIQREA